MTDVRILSKAEASSTKLLKNYPLTLSLHKKYSNSVNLGITKTLASKYLEFEPKLVLRLEFQSPDDYFLV